MSKKNWIMVKRGLSEDAKHREAMGVKVWLFMHIIDRADWSVGKVFDWRDKDEAEDMGISWRTLQAQRQELENMNYITCIQKQDRQEIIIHEWVNPRDYGGGVMNSLKGGTQNQVHQEIEGTPQGTRQSTRKGSSKPSTPTLDDQGSGNQGSGDSGKPPRASKQKPDELKIESVFLGTEIIAQLKIANSALGRKSPSYFANPQQRDQFDVALKTLNGQGKALIVKGIAQRGTGLSALGAWLEACAKNQNQPRYQKQSGSGVTLLEAIQQSQEADSGD